MVNIQNINNVKINLKFVKHIFKVSKIKIEKILTNLKMSKTIGKTNLKILNTILC